MNHELIDILLEKEIYYRTTNDPNEIILRCNTGEHADKDPSLHFNLQKNIFQCWSCGFKGGINKYLASIGITTPLNSARTDINIRRNILKDKVENLRNKDKLVDLPEDRMLYKSSYRMISQATVEKLECFTTEFHKLKGYLCFPIKQFDTLRFIEARLLNEDPNEAKSKWTRFPSGLDMTNMLYPLDELQKVGSAILVEGLLDCLYLRELGYNNTLCIFGTNGFSPIKAQILKNYGVVNIISLMDGDVAGQRAAERIQNICKRTKINCTKIDLDLNRDPKTYTLYELTRLLGEPIKNE